MLRFICPSLFTRARTTLCLVVLAGCGASKSSTDTTADAAPHPSADAYVPPLVSDAPLNKDAEALLKKDASDNPSPDATQVRADVVIPDAAASSKDSGSEAAVIPTDTMATVDSTPARLDTAEHDDLALRTDARAPDSVTKEPDAASTCTPITPTPPLEHLTAKELKTILDSSEDPYLINVKGSSIANIPGTDAVLASDVPGIEALVGKNLCADIILYCKTGVTSQTVGNQLVAKGYQHVRDLSGGITAWTAAGYPTE